MALAAVAYAKQMDRKAIIPCVSSIGPGATNMVTACGCATANRIPLLVLPCDTFACRQPDPVLQQAEFSIISAERLPMRSRAFAIILTEFCAPSSL